ncbi:MAG: hypothetical protein QOJ59_2653 [Thermomicrobiales bacterium]|jgi:DNA-binding MurR/RpiR family transcriptional regulator|nr:hypothetical protein [Thermomicrobiales bacterium]
MCLPRYDGDASLCLLEKEAVVVVSPDPLAGSVRTRIESDITQLSKKQQRVAHYILDNPTMVLFAAAADVAQGAGVDPATVVRFAQSLGFAGYTDLRDRLRLEFPALRTPLDRWEDEGGRLESTSTAILIEQVRAQTVANLDKTFEQLDPRMIDAALDLLLNAERTILAGGGSSRALVMQLHRVLQVAQIPTQLIEDWFGLLFDAASFKPNDVLFAATTWRYAKVTIEALRYAHEAGARTILLTDAQFAPGTNIADVVLLFSPQAIAELASPVAGAAVIDCLAAGFAARIPERVKESLSQVASISAAQGLVYD